MTTLSLALAVTATTLRVTALALTAAADQVGPRVEVGPRA